MQTLPTQLTQRWLFRPPPATLFRPPPPPSSREAIRVDISQFNESDVSPVRDGHGLVDRLREVSVRFLPTKAQWRTLWQRESARLRRTWRVHHAWLVSGLVVSLFSQLLVPNAFAAYRPTYAAEQLIPQTTAVMAQEVAPALVGPPELVDANPTLTALWSDFASMVIQEAVASQVPDLYETFAGEPTLKHPGQDFANLPATQAYIERYRPADDWLDTVERKPLSPIFAANNEYWKEDGRVLKIEDGFVITRIPERMAPLYEYVEQLTGVSRYILMAIATIESKQGISTVSPTNCQGWGHFCPGTIRLFEGKDLLPENFNTYDPFDGIMGIAIHLRVSALGTGAYKNLFNPDSAFDTMGWPDLWNGETPSFRQFEAKSQKFPIIQATWGYNRSAFYGYSVTHLAKFYQDRDHI